MSLTVLECVELNIDAEDDIILVRRRVRDLAQASRFNVFGTSAITTAASELARNVWVHAGRGSARVERLSDDEGRSGVRLTVKDEGPGIDNLDRALSGTYSSANSMGLGLSGSKRLVDAFTIESAPGAGTTVTLVKWTLF
jgi:serine/threonine-protein kinase RsbT